MTSRNFEFMFFGFAAAWTILLIYVLTLVGRSRRLRSELDDVRRLIAHHPSEPPVTYSSASAVPSQRDPAA